MQVSPSLIKRQKTHFHNLTCGASIILGNNGYIWIYPTPGQQDEEAGGYYTSLEVRRMLVVIEKLFILQCEILVSYLIPVFLIWFGFQPVPLSDREVISRLRNCLLALAAHKVMLYDTSILYYYESSLTHQVLFDYRAEQYYYNIHIMTNCVTMQVNTIVFLAVC